MLRASVIPVLRACEKAVVAARRGARMVVAITLSLVIVPMIVVPMIIPMNVCLHGVMLIRATIVRSILRADQRRSHSGHGESCKKGEHFPKMLAHIAFLLLG
jgi:hypothetical protein